MRVLAVLLVMVASAHAEKPSSSKAKAEAKAHFAEGDKAFRLGDFARAVEEYRQSYELFPAPLLLYDLGQAYRKLGDYEKALHAYQQFLETSPTAEERATVESLVGELKGLVEEQRKAQASPPAGTTPPIKEEAKNPAPAPQPVAATDSSPPRRLWIIGVVAAAIAVVAAGIIITAVAVSPHDAPVPSTSAGYGAVTF